MPGAVVPGVLIASYPDEYMTLSVRWWKGLLSACAACMLAGCIVVDDFGEYWAKGSVDPCVNAILDGDMREDGEPVADINTVARSLHMGTHRFAMLRDLPEENKGNLFRYAVKDGSFVMYRLNEKMRDAFTIRYPDSGVIIDSATAKIPVLDARMMNILVQIADDPEYWIEASREPYNPQQRLECKD